MLIDITTLAVAVFASLSSIPLVYRWARGVYKSWRRYRDKRRRERMALTARRALLSELRGSIRAAGAERRDVVVVCTNDWLHSGILPAWGTILGGVVKERSWAKGLSGGHIHLEPHFVLKHDSRVHVFHEATTLANTGKARGVRVVGVRRGAVVPLSDRHSPDGYHVLVCTERGGERLLDEALKGLERAVVGEYGSTALIQE